MLIKQELATIQSAPKFFPQSRKRRARPAVQDTRMWALEGPLLRTFLDVNPEEVRKSGPYAIGIETQKFRMDNALGHDPANAVATRATKNSGGASPT